MDEFFAMFDPDTVAEGINPPRPSRAERVSKRKFELKEAIRKAEEEEASKNRPASSTAGAPKAAAAATATTAAAAAAAAAGKKGPAGAKEQAAKAGSNGSQISNSNAENNTEFYYGTAKAGQSTSGKRAAASTRSHTGKQSRSAQISSKGMKGAAAAAAATAIGHGGRSGGPQKPPRHLSPIKSILSFMLIFATMGVLAVGILVGIVFLKAPNIETDNIYSQIKQRSIVYDSEGKEIDSLYFDGGNRTIVKYDQIPENMVNAIVSIEDNKFWTHHGFNFVRMIGAIRDSVMGGGEISGTSTITQQLARNF
jgi:penicillin-binding protein 1A